MIRDKLNDGQLIDSKLSIRDVSTISESFLRVLKGMYHERIPYPKMDHDDHQKTEHDEKETETIMLKSKPVKRK